MPLRSQPLNANTPGCSALNIASSRWTRLISSRSSEVIRPMSRTPSVAAITVAVVHAIPLVVNVRL